MNDIGDQVSNNMLGKEQAGSAGATQQQQVVPPAFILFTFILIVALQCLIQFWKKAHRKSYILTTFILMWIFPIMFIVLFNPWKPFIRMLLVWLIYTSVTGWIFYLSFQKKLAKNTPKKVYAWFLLIYKLSHLATMGGAIGMAVELFTGVFSTLQHKVLRDSSLLLFFFPQPHILLFYGLYYGVLVRDCAEMCAEAMSNSMTKERNQYYLSQSVMDRTCGICNLALKGEDNSILRDLTEVEEMMSDNSTAELSQSTQPSKKSVTKQETKTLSCGHKFHEFCLRGWMLVGKKDVCPFCSEKIEFKEVSKHVKQPWQSDSLLFVQALELVRYIMVWNPIIVLAIHVVFVLYFFIHH